MNSNDYSALLHWLAIDCRVDHIDVHHFCGVSEAKRRATIRRLIDDAQQPKRRKNAKDIVVFGDGKLMGSRVHGTEDASDAEKNEDESPPDTSG